MSSGFREVKYAEMVALDEKRVDENRNQNCGRSDSVCPLTETGLLSRESGAENEEKLEFKKRRYYEPRNYRKLAILFAGIAIMLTIVIIILSSLLGSSRASQKACTDPECISAADRILSKMNRSANPCDDFFTYSCGQWMRDHVIPEDKSMLSVFDGVKEKVSTVLKRVLEEERSDDRESVKKAKTYFKSCMDTETIDSLGGRPILEMIDQLGGMPLFGDPLPPSFTVEESLSNSMTKYRTAVLFWWGVDADNKNSSSYIFQVHEGDLGMPTRDYYINNQRRMSTLPSYTKFMYDYLAKIWKEKNASDFNENELKAMLNQTIHFETKVAKLMTPLEKKRDWRANYRKRSIRDMNSIGGGPFSWEKYINATFRLANRTVQPTTEIVSFADTFIRNVTWLIENYDNESLQNYIVWMNLKSYIGLLGKEYRDTMSPYNLALSGTSKEKPRWQSCSYATKSRFDMPVGSLFVRDAFSEQSKGATEAMVNHIRDSFIDFLPSNDWMDDATKARSREKAEKIIPVIGYPDYVTNEEDPTMDEEYESYEVMQSEYFKNVIRIQIESSKNLLMILDDTVDRNQWLTSPATVNAFYSATRNQISFPAAILQPPFYDEAQPSSMNYGGIGMVIGHEITHGFDDMGSDYNGDGDLEKWWSAESRRNFEQKSECIERQYGDYFWPEANQKLNGKLTLGENIADNGGIRQAYKAYEKWRSVNGEDLKLPGLENFSEDQLFFLNNAQIWCSLVRPQFAATAVATNSHSPGLFRVIGALSNFEKFGEAYNCKRGLDKMYPNKNDSCRVW